ncbi:uncharacterized protein LOC127860463 [Dreissena polymorpha]|uniref:LRAT domain-containing protein n=1 Tax=Dreissena polymorpha TaxID=45954 RepID=A0A9D3YPJ3_DREPO|nr:uncharacterized protein LOC127860463 [Dreissena polymorpha]KAH3702818.1 hypothetical protein DPMN_077844 [Dreissena polymorpha]
MVCQHRNCLKPYTYGCTDDILGFLCTECRAEWLKEEYTHRTGTTGFTFQNTDYWKQANNYKREDGVFQLSSNRTQLEKKACKLLKPGDHIAWNRKYGYYHHAIVVFVDYLNKNCFWVISYTSGTEHTSENTEGKGRIIMKWINMEEENGDLFRVDYLPEVTEVNTVELVLARSYARLGETKYSLLFNNCETFATFGKTGVSECCHWRHALENVTNMLFMEITRLSANRMAYLLIREITNRAVKEANKGKLIVEVSEFLKMANISPSRIGQGITIIAITGLMIWKIYKIYSKRRDGHMSLNAFIETAMQTIIQGLGPAIGFGFDGEIIEKLISSAVPGMETYLKTTLGSVIGALSRMFIGYFTGNLLVPKISQRITKKLVRDDKRIKRFNEIAPGDHIIHYGWILHQSCHAIVVGIDIDNKSENLKIRVIKNTYKKGVIKDCLMVKYALRKNQNTTDTCNDHEHIEIIDPIYKVVYSDDEANTSDKVVIRAKEKLGQSCYSMFRFNCKDFALWCKCKQ